MRKMIGFYLLTVLMLLCNSITATAQCGLSGSSYYCQAVSPTAGSSSSWFDVWAAESNGYTISVYLEVYEGGDPFFNPNAFADIVLGNFYWSEHIYGGNFSDSFIAAGSGETLELYTYASGGEAHIQAAW
jgi:hypothetical protein